MTIDPGDDPVSDDDSFSKDAYRQPESAELIAELRSNGEQVLASMFAAHRERYWHLVNFRMDRRIAARVDADDVLQEAFVAAVSRLDHFLKDPAFSLFVWLRMIVSQTLIDVHRRHFGAEKRSAGREISLGKQYPQTTSVSLASQLVANQTSPSGAAARDESSVALTEAIGTMSPLDQETIALRHFEGLSNSETAEVLGISVTAASNRYVRALSRLKEILQDLNLSE